MLKALFGSANDRYIKKLKKVVNKINELEPTFAALSDNELQNKTNEFKVRFNEGETLDSLLPEAFATVREASKRVLGMRPFDVQLIGGMVLNTAQIAEMKTGEGKTLVATLPVYLNAITGKGRRPYSKLSKIVCTSWRALESGNACNTGFFAAIAWLICLSVKMTPASGGSKAVVFWIALRAV